MDYEREIQKLNERLDNLQKSFIQAQKNQTPITAKTDTTSNRVDAITPYVETKTAYYGEKEKTFYGVPSGNVSIFFDNYSGEYTVTRNWIGVTVSFPTLEKETSITIMVQ